MGSPGAFVGVSEQALEPVAEVDRDVAGSQSVGRLSIHGAELSEHVTIQLVADSTLHGKDGLGAVQVNDCQAKAAEVVASIGIFDASVGSHVPPLGEQDGEDIALASSGRLAQPINRNGGLSVLAGKHRLGKEDIEANADEGLDVFANIRIQRVGASQSKGDVCGGFHRLGKAHSGEGGSGGREQKSLHPYFSPFLTGTHERSRLFYWVCASRSNPEAKVFERYTRFSVAELVFELGCEELPASQVTRAAQVLAKEITSRLKEARLESGPPEALSTPRRLLVKVSEIPPRQADEEKRQRGPSATAAFGSDGSPSKALEGFLKSQGADVSHVERDGDYIWVTKTLPGRTALEVLSEILPEAVKAIPFDKTMRWGSGRMRFSRPIRWILALLDGEVVPFTLEGVTSGRQSKGHRFISPGFFEADSWTGLLQGLRSRSVEPDPEARRTAIISQIHALAPTALVSEDLVDENVHLTEWPQVTVGSFKEDFLELPEPVLMTAMAKHEKMFPVASPQGGLTNQFVFVRNGGEEEKVKAGNAWVLNARFNDARFFFREDRKSNLDAFLERTAGMVFVEKVGTVRQRADRLAKLMEFLCPSIPGAGQAGLYAKADLSAGLVAELSSLQGVIGGDYAAREGFAPEVCAAIACQYSLSRALSQEGPARTLAVSLVCADQIDRLAGCLGAGLLPTGSSDPYALRRAAGILIEAGFNEEAAIDWLPALNEAHRLCVEQGLELSSFEETATAFKALLAQRYESQLEGLRYDAVQAALEAGVTQPKLVKFRAEVMEQLRTNPDLVQTLLRPANILAAAEKKGLLIGDIPESGTDLSEGLADACASALRAMNGAFTSLDQAQALEALRTLADPINAYFERTMVMAEDEAVRASRLALVKKSAEAAELLGDVRKLVIED